MDTSEYQNYEGAFDKPSLYLTIVLLQWCSRLINLRVPLLYDNAGILFLMVVLVT